MNRQENWKEALAESPFVQPRFTERLRQEIIRKTKHRQKPHFHLTHVGIAFAVLLLCGGTVWIANLVAEQNAPDSVNPVNEVRTEYLMGDKALFTVFPEPDLTAGKPQGYMIRFTEPFEKYEGKKLGIEAFHIESGQHITVVSPETVSEPSPGYPSLGRYTALFGLPLSGVWRFEVKLDDRVYGDFVLDVKEEPSPWKPSPTFELPYVRDGQSHKNVLAGEKGKMGFIVGPYVNEKGEILDRQPMIAGKFNKYMWQFWGSEDELSGEFRVHAVKEGAKREIGIFSTTLGGHDYIPSSMGLPEAGMWRLNAYINNRLIGSIYVKVDPK